MTELVDYLVNLVIYVWQHPNEVVCVEFKNDEDALCEAGFILGL